MSFSSFCTSFPCLPPSAAHFFRCGGYGGKDCRRLGSAKKKPSFRKTFSDHFQVKKLTIWVSITRCRRRTTGWEYHISKHDTGHPTPENPLWEFSLTSAVTLSSRRITLIWLDDYIGVSRHQLHIIDVACLYPFQKFLPGFFQEAA